MNHHLFCYNCYKFGHTSKNCVSPIISYGIICYLIDEHEELQYLMVERKFSFTFVDFLLGRYDIFDYDYLQMMFNKMTLYERTLLCNNNFRCLWCKLFTCESQTFYKKSIQTEFCRASIKFYILQNGFKSIYNNKIYCIQNFTKNCTYNYKTPEWYFPKGKKLNQFETPQECALREFEEETNIMKNCIIVNNDIEPIIEEHLADNHKTYKVIFFIAKCIEKPINLTPIHNSEIGNVDFLDYTKCIEKFRIYENEKFKLVNDIHKFLTNKNK